jgi:hypothetical protein
MDNKFKDYLNTGFGKRATHLLREGATIKVLVDKAPFSLSKHEGKMEMSPGDPKSYGVLLEISSAAIEDLSSAKAEEDAQERLEQLIYHPTAERYARMKITVEPTEKGRIEFYYNGYFYWARRMRFAN